MFTLFLSFTIECAVTIRSFSALSNFKTLEKADLHEDGDSPMVRKAFSSVITRYFIFREKHPEITDEENKILYFKLGLDLVAKYFSEYPETTTDNLVGFQVVLRNYVKEHKAELTQAEAV